MSEHRAAAVEASREEEFDPLIGPIDEPGRSDLDTAAGPLPGARYRWVHAIYAVIVTVLIASAIPIQFPDLRASLIGGYGRSFATVHEWAGVAMLTLPVIVFGATPRRALETIWIRSYRRDHLRWHAINLWFTLVSGLLFIVSGFLMWFPGRLSDAVVDTAADVHSTFSYVLYIMVPLHLIIASKRTWQVLRDWAGVRLGSHPRTELPTNSQRKTEDLAC